MIIEKFVVIELFNPGIISFYIHNRIKLRLQLDDGSVTFLTFCHDPPDKMFMMLNNVDIEQDMLWRRKTVMDMKRTQKCHQKYRMGKIHENQKANCPFFLQDDILNDAKVVPYH